MRTRTHEHEPRYVDMACVRAEGKASNFKGDMYTGEEILGGD